MTSKALHPVERSAGGAAIVIVSAFVSMFLGSLILSKIEASSRVKSATALGTGAILGVLLGHRYGAVGWGIGAGLGGLGLTALFAEFAGAVNAGEAFGFQRKSFGGAGETPRLRAGA